MPIITLTSDLGLKDYYVAALKGMIFSAGQDITIVDISHGVMPFNILEAGFLVRSVIPFYPKGSVHLVCVENPKIDNKELAIVLFKDVFLIGPNNEVLSLITEDQETRSWICTPEYAEFHSFPALSFYTKIAIEIARGTDPSNFGIEGKIERSLWLNPTISKNNVLRGNIIYSDHFGNAVTNLKTQEFLKFQAERNFTFSIRNVVFNRLMKHYSDVIRGEPLLLSGSHGMLEVAFNDGSAYKLLGIKEDDLFSIELV